jgi:hypothetical protein
MAMGPERQAGAGTGETEPGGEELELRDPRVPDFFIVGQPKSGTTALYAMLRTHPQIFMPDFKEPRFYADDLPSRFQEPRASGLPAETYEDYLALFAPAGEGQLVGEASTAYIWSQSAASRIARARPEAKIIVILREPAAYLRSLHLQLMEIRIEDAKTLRKALALEDERRAGRHVPREIGNWPQVLLYTDRVAYVEQLRRYHAVFAPEQVLVLIYDDFRADNEGTVRRVLAFLGVDQQAPVTVTEANPTVRMRSARVDGMVRSVTVGGNPIARNARRALKLVLPESARERLRFLIWRRLVFGSPRPADEELTIELRRRFKGEVQELSEYLGRDLVKLWGYDQLG